MGEGASPTLWELIGQSLSSTKRGYDRLAPKFDRSPFRTPDEVLAGVASVVGPQKGGRLLDLGCGTGAAMEAMDRLGFEQMVGRDMSSGMLAKARQNLSDRLMTPHRLELGDIRHLKAHQAYDVALCMGAVGHVRRRDQRRYLDGIYRSLKPGGRYFFVTSRRPQWWSPRRWAAWAFNQLMRLRNRLISPPFHMYYLLLPVERAQWLLPQRGFEVRVHAPFKGPRLSTLRLVEGRRVSA